MRTFSSSPRPLLLLALAGASVAAARPAGAQPPPASPPASAPIVVPAAAADPIAIALAPQPGGLTPEEVARIVARNKHSVRSKQEDLKAAAARVDQAFVRFFPTVTAGLSYTYLSPVGLNFSNALALQPNTPPAVIAAFKSEFQYVAPITIPTNNTALTATVSLPVSDYVLRIAQNYSAASHNAESARYTAEAEALQAGADAKIAYFNWVHAKGGIVVAKEAVDQAQAHLDDVKKSFAVGLSSKADVLRIDAQVAAAQQSHAEAIAFAAVAEEQLRVLLGVPGDAPLAIGSDVMNEPPVSPNQTLAAANEQALSRRLELRSLDEAVVSLRKSKLVAEAGYAPRVDAFLDGTYANPNQRIFPASPVWTGTWDAGVRLSWTLNDTFTTIGVSAEMKARIASLIEQRGALSDGLRLEVASAYADALKAAPTIEAADRGMIAAEESLRVRRELFRNGKATSTELIDAEGELTRARLRKLDAHVGQLVARARLDHATGRDAPVRPVSD
jgi:outer membrane protein TolC